MAWGLQNSLVTSTLPNVATVTDGNISGDTDLNPGDALDYTADHVVLFDHWTDSSGDFAYDAEHTYGQVANQMTDNIYDSTLEGYAMSDFEALQYNNITSGTAPLEVAFQANTGDLYTYNPATNGSQNIGLGVAAYTSPAIADLPGGGFEVAFQANGTDDLYMYDSQTNTSWNTNLGMASESSPAIAASPDGGVEVAFEPTPATCTCTTRSPTAATTSTSAWTSGPARPSPPRLTAVTRSRSRPTPTTCTPTRRRVEGQSCFVNAVSNGHFVSLRCTFRRPTRTKSSTQGAGRGT